MQLLVVYVTAPAASAEPLARALVTRRLAACVNVVPEVRSIYRWQGAVEDARESLLIIKTTEAALPALEAAVHEIHPYEVPEVLALPVNHASAAYGAWLAANVQPPGSGAKP